MTPSSNSAPRPSVVPSTLARSSSNSPACVWVDHSEDFELATTTGAQSASTTRTDALATATPAMPTGTARTGLVLIDIDDLPDTATPDCIKYLLTHAAEPVVLAWTSARGRGLKVAVMTSPTPATADETRWAWEAARRFMVDLLKSAGLQEGLDYKIDPTFAIPQLAILAHDPSPLGRVPDSACAVPWTPGEPAPRGLTTGSGAVLLQSPDVNALITQLPWVAGGRSAAMYRLGIASALSGIPFETGRVSATAVAHSSGMVKDYGFYGAVRHYDRGYWWGADQSWDAGL